MNINCKPVSLFSWNFDLTGGPHRVKLEFDWLTEQGDLNLENAHYEIEKQSFLSGHWYLNQDGKTLYQANKPSAFSRRFEISGPSSKAILEPAGWGRTTILKGPKVSLKISPKNPFSRQATISGESEDFLQAIFAFWLTALTWKRQAKSNA